MLNKIKKMFAVCMGVLVGAIFFTACAPESLPYVQEGFSVVVDYNDGISRPRTYYTDENDAIGEPATPIREGYTLSGWFKEKEGGERISFPYTPSADEIVYAQWIAEEYDVTFDFNVEGSTPFVQQIAYNQTVSAPSEDIFPTNPGHYFYRWETRAEGGDPVSFPYTVRRDTAFYAAWLSDDIRIYHIGFDANYPESPAFEGIDVIQGETIAQRNVPDPERTGYELLGWATTPDAVEPDVSFPYSPDSSLTLYAVWEQQTYLVRFRYNYTGAPGGLAQAFEEVRILGGESVSEPGNLPVREGFEFIGWYNANAGGERIGFPYEVTRATTFYAHWRANSITPSNNRFDAEFTPISPTYASPTYSGNATGTQIIEEDDGSRNAYSDTYPLLDDRHLVHSNYYVGALYVRGASLTFTIYSSERVTGVSLYASLAVEINQNVVLTPEGQFGFQFIVNNTPIDYGSIDLTRPNITPGGMHHSAFEEYRIASNLTLNAGANTITLMVNNDYITSAMRAMSPLVDYIRLDTGNSDATLSWHPEYDNLYRTV